MLASFLVAANARAQEAFVEPPVEMHGFVSQGFIKTTSNDYLASSERGSFEFTDWFEVTLDYRLVGEAPAEDEELAALGTPIVVEPR